jgi:hypothetical protein
VVPLGKVGRALWTVWTYDGPIVESTTHDDDATARHDDAARRV